MSTPKKARRAEQGKARHQAPREAFSLSRRREYFEEGELTKQLGYPRRLWHLVIAKETIDNALDNCEEIGVLPDVTFRVDDDGMSCMDNGSGIPSETVKGIIDLDNRISSRMAFRSPTRGAQGNAGKCLLGMPLVMNGDEGRVTIAARGSHHEITTRIDPIARQPGISHAEGPGDVQSGTFLKIWLPNFACTLSEWEKSQIVHFGRSYAALNPHANITFDIAGNRLSWTRTVERCGKWTPGKPDPPAWYDSASFEELVASCLKADRDRGTDRLLSGFLRYFEGMKRSAVLKAVCDETGLLRCRLSSLVNCDGIDSARTSALLGAMQRAVKAARPERLGLIGRSHIEHVFGERDIDGPIKYKKASGFTDDGLPFIVEAAFAERSEEAARTLITGVNFSPSIERSVVQDLDWLLERQMVQEDSSTVLLLHITTPAPTYLDRGKSVIETQGHLEEAVEKCVVSVTADFCKEMKAAERDAERQQKRRERQRQKREREGAKPKVSLKDAIIAVLEEAVLKASGGGACDFSDRDFYYAARELIQQYTTASLSQGYFDKVVDAWEEEHGLVPGRERDPRGYLLEPHTGKEVPLGTKHVDEYEIPAHLYHTILYFEKKGLLPKLKLGKIPEKYDAAIVCAEGYAVRAGKALLQAAQKGHHMRVICFHDADPDGYNIARTLSAPSAAHHFEIDVIDAGLHLAEALEMSLSTESFTRKKQLPRGLELSDLELEYFGGTPQRIIGKNDKPKTQWVNCRRVELNALSADPHAFVKWVEAKLAQHGADKKVVPPKDVIKLYAASTRNDEIKRFVREHIDQLINVDGIVSKVTEKMARKVSVADISKELRAWAKTLTPLSWHTHLVSLVSVKTASHREAIRAATEAELKKAK